MVTKTTQRRAQAAGRVTQSGLRCQRAHFTASLQWSVVVTRGHWPSVRYTERQSVRFVDVDSRRCRIYGRRRQRVTSPRVT